jgi:hypothetical protein
MELGKGRAGSPLSCGAIIGMGHSGRQWPIHGLL